jgi:hypothetical protein
MILNDPPRHFNPAFRLICGTFPPQRQGLVSEKNRQNSGQVARPKQHSANFNFDRHPLRR